MNSEIPYRMQQIYKEANGGDLSDIVDKAIFALPFEVHIPFSEGKAHYCGPGTKFDERVKRGDKGVNYLDSECKNHDYAYGNYPKGSQERYQADLNLIGVSNKFGRDPSTTAWNRFLANYVITPAIRFQANNNRPKGGKKHRKRRERRRYH